MKWLILAVLFVLLIVVLTRRSRRSGVGREQLLRSLPGDDIIGDAGFVADRAALIHAPADEVWARLLQFGNRQATGYAPAWLERLLIYSHYKRRSRSASASCQAAHSLKVLATDPPHSLVYAVSKDDDHPEQYVLSWAHVIEPIDKQSCRLYTRLRKRRSSHKLLRGVTLFLPIGGVYDYFLTALMFTGLKQRLEK